MTEIVLPNDTNIFGNMFGGRLMALMDKCAAISAQRHANMVCVTASVDSVEFQAPIYQGDIVIIESWVNRAFRTSLEVELNVVAEDAPKKTRRQCNHAFFTFVAIGENGRPTRAPVLHPENAEERQRYEAAGMRRAARLFFSGRLALGDTKFVMEDLIAAISTKV